MQIGIVIVRKDLNLTPKMKRKGMLQKDKPQVKQPSENKEDPKVEN